MEAVRTGCVGMRPFSFVLRPCVLASSSFGQRRATGTRQHVVDEDDSSGTAWEHSTGLLSADILSAHLPPASAQPALFLCGPPGLERAARKMLKQLGHDESRTADF